MTTQWIRPLRCEANGCVEVALLADGKKVAIRSSQRPHLVAILDAEEWQRQLRTGEFPEVPS